MHELLEFLLLRLDDAELDQLACHAFDHTFEQWPPQAVDLQEVR